MTVLKNGSTYGERQYTDAQGHVLGWNLPELKCNGCTACCKGETILLTNSDEWWEYETRLVDRPGRPEPEVALAQKEDGSCVYLGEGGCTIYERRPYSCRLFDCRRLYLRSTPTERNERVRINRQILKVYAAARARLVMAGYLK